MIAIYALAITSLVGMLALVVDLGQIRADRRVNKASADLAARAGVSRLSAGAWPAACEARNYLLGNTPEFSAFDGGSESWSLPATPPVALVASPCANTTSSPYVNQCTPNNPSTWARLTATALGGRVTIEIRAGYVMPDARFPADLVTPTDNGDPALGSCDNLAVILTEHRDPLFGAVLGSTGHTTTIRSVGRLNATANLDFIPALLLLDQHGCDTLVTGGANTRVYAQPYQDHPGVIQIDSAKDSGCNLNQPVLNGQATSGGPSIVVCSAKTSSVTPGCNLGTDNKSARVGIYALNLSRPTNDLVTSSYPSTYGDTQAVASPRSTRRRVDLLYRPAISTLDATAKQVITQNAGKPPGCTTVVANSCTGNGITWVVLQQADCNNQALFFLVPGRSTAQNVWFNCDLTVSTPLVLSGLDSYVVVTGSVTVRSAFSILDPRKLYIGGKATGNKIGLDVGGAGSIFSVNLASALDCLARAGLGKTTRIVIGSGSFNMSSGGTAHLCQSFVLLASGYDKVPASDGTLPCDSPCDTYTGTLNIGSNSFTDWTAPNVVNGRAPTTAELVTYPYEDLALWTEAGGNTNSLTGGSLTSLAGIYFMGNAKAFNLAGNGALPILLSAQFISQSMKVTGGAVVNLVPNPFDSVAIIVYSVLLVR